VVLELRALLVIGRVPGQRRIEIHKSLEGIILMKKEIEIRNGMQSLLDSSETHHGPFHGDPQSFLSYNH